MPKLIYTASQRRELFDAIKQDVASGESNRSACAKHKVKLSNYNNWVKRFSKEQSRQTLPVGQSPLKPSVNIARQVTVVIGSPEAISDVLKGMR